MAASTGCWRPSRARAIHAAFVQARAIAVERLRDVWLGSANRMTLPWLGASMERTLAVMGEGFRSHGFTANRAEIDTMCRYSVEQFLAVRRVMPEELFHPAVLDT